jgi:hypothetical protein
MVNIDESRGRRNDSDRMARCHRDPVAAQSRRKELERLLDERFRKDGQS